MLVFIFMGIGFRDSGARLAHMQRLRPELANNDLSAKYAPPATLMQSHKCKYPFAKQKDFQKDSRHSPLSESRLPFHTAKDRNET